MAFGSDAMDSMRFSLVHLDSWMDEYTPSSSSTQSKRDCLISIFTFDTLSATNISDMVSFLRVNIDGVASRVLIQM